MIDFAQLRELYRTTLLDDVIPFWMRHAIDPDGGINTCIRDDGTWSTAIAGAGRSGGRSGCSASCTTAVERRPEWLKIAEGIYSFLTAHGPLDDGHWPLLLDGDGNVQRGYESIFNDGFAIYGLVEFWRACRKEKLPRPGHGDVQATEKSLNGSEPPPAWPYPIPAGRINHGISMLFSLVYHELADATGRPGRARGQPGATTSE